MHRRNATLLILLGFATAWIASRGVGSPGYMDADYYFSMGQQWAQGLGNEEPFLWNYLGQPETIPTLSHGYWSPLTSIFVGLALRLFGTSFSIAQIPFVLFTGFLPFLVWRLALAMGSDPTAALQSGLLALAPGFFLPFFVTTDMFSLYALLGVLLMLVLQTKAERFNSVRWVVAGILCGLAHLSRADGFLFLVIPVAYVYLLPTGRWQKWGLLVFGYFLIMTPWFYRNLILFGSPLNPAGGRTLWLLSYDEIFSFPADSLTPERWWATGLKQILLERGSAALMILQRIVAENGLVFLAPFMILGSRAQWKHALVRATVLYLFSLFLVMSTIFPFAGARGGWFHSSVAAMPLLWVMAPHGLRACVDWAGKRRNWDTLRAGRMFGVAMITMALLLNWGLFANRVRGIGPEPGNWDLAQARYERIRDAIQASDPESGVVAINNPPGFYHVSGMKSVALPFGDIGVLEQVVEQYGVTWIVIDSNHPQALESLFLQQDLPPWVKVETSLVIYGQTFILYRVVEA